MDRFVLHFREEDAFENAEKRFIATCGFNFEKSKHRRMMEMGSAVRENGIEGINIRAIYRFCPAECYKGDRIVIDDEEITFPYLTHISEESVKGIYLYMLTAGECLFETEEKIMEFLYADIWGTTYVDSGMGLLEQAIRDDLKERFAGDDKAFLSDEFGPGYFGMPVNNSKILMRILDGSEIGIRVKDSGLLIPQKSCAGIFFVLDRPDFKPEPECLRCTGNSKGCGFCRIRQEQLERRA